MLLSILYNRCLIDTKLLIICEDIIISSKGLSSKEEVLR